MNSIGGLELQLDILGNMVILFNTKVYSQQLVILAKHKDRDKREAASLALSIR